MNAPSFRALHDNPHSSTYILPDGTQIDREEGLFFAVRTTRTSAPLLHDLNALCAIGTAFPLSSALGDQLECAAQKGNGLRVVDTPEALYIVKNALMFNMAYKKQRVMEEASADRVIEDVFSEAFVQDSTLTCYSSAHFDPLCLGLDSSTWRMGTPRTDWTIDVMVFAVTRAEIACVLVGDTD